MIETQFAFINHLCIIIYIDKLKVNRLSEKNLKSRRNYDF